MSKRIKSPLRYPGGKSKAAVMIADIIGKELKPGELVVSPFCGGCSVELELAGRGLGVFASDKFLPLMWFWHCLQTDKEKLIDEIIEISEKSGYEMGIFTFGICKDQMQKTENPKLKAALFYILNRCGYSGLLSGGIQEGCPRWTKHHIEKLAKFKVPSSMCFGSLDYKDAIRVYSNRFIYCDPPYVIENGDYYGYDGELHYGFDHQELAEILKSRGRWLLSYNDCPEIRELYKGFRMITPEWSYGMAAKNSSELLIFSEDFEAPDV